MIQRNKK